jgi:DNA-binding Xre family transcriptional regulator
MKSTRNKHIIPRLVVVSNLGTLLRERGISQKRLAQMTGISERAISRLKNRKVVKRIDCDTAVRVCLALSGAGRPADRAQSSIRLDALFPIRPDSLLLKKDPIPPTK